MKLQAGRVYILINTKDTIFSHEDDPFRLVKLLDYKHIDDGAIDCKVLGLKDRVYLTEQVVWSNQLKAASEKDRSLFNTYYKELNLLLGLVSKP